VSAPQRYLFPSIYFEEVILTYTVIEADCPEEFTGHSIYHLQLKLHSFQNGLERQSFPRHFPNKILYSNDWEIKYVTVCETVHFAEENTTFIIFSQ
jgi:hypothetical protein